jgi:dephospho-CoA kinase
MKYQLVIHYRKCYNGDMKIIILTGSIATGKSTVLARCKLLRIPALNTDALAHELLAHGGAAVKEVAKLFPESLVNKDGSSFIDRHKLGKIVFADGKKLTQLEHVLHPLIRKKEQAWIRKQRYQGRKKVVIEVPLFFEKWRKYHPHTDIVVVTSASLWMMKKRALARQEMTPAKLSRILKRQWPTAKKAAFADVVIHTGLGHAHSVRQINSL